MNKPTTVPPEVAAWIHSYRPKGLKGAWDEQLRDFVMPSVLASGPTGLDEARIRALVLSRLAAWCLVQGIDLDVELALDPDTVERFVTTAAIAARSRATYRSVLRQLGPMLTRRVPWEPRPRPLARRHVAAPYTPTELNMLRRDAMHQSTPLRRRAATALIALGAGAGLDARWALDVHADGITITAGIVRVAVAGPAPRTVVVLAAFEDDVVALARLSADGLPLVGSSAEGRNRASKLAGSIEFGAASPRLSLPRLRSTWLATHLRLGTRLPELAAAAGLAGITVLSDLLTDIEPLDDMSAARMLRGDR